MRMSPKGIDFLAAWEGGCREQIYLDSAGYPTIGVGHLIVDGEDYIEGVEYDRDDLMRIFADDVGDAENAVSRHVRVTLKPHQFDALTSFVFNCGETAFRRSTLLARINANDFEDVPYQLSRWNKAGGQEVHGLIRRRKAEGQCFSFGVYNGP